MVLSQEGVQSHAVQRRRALRRRGARQFPRRRHGLPRGRQEVHDVRRLHRDEGGLRVREPAGRDERADIRAAHPHDARHKRAPLLLLLPVRRRDRRDRARQAPAGTLDPPSVARMDGGGGRPWARRRGYNAVQGGEELLQLACAGCGSDARMAHDPGVDRKREVVFGVDRGDNVQGPVEGVRRWRRARGRDCR